MENLRDQLMALPKVELHLHLDGSVNPETILELAQKEGIDLPTENLDELRRYLEVPEDCKSLGEYLQKFEFPLAVMQTKEGLKRIAYELCERVAKENVRYFEVRFAPQLHTRKGLTLNEVVEAVLDGLNEGKREFNVKAGLILCAMRHQPVEINLEIADLAARFKEKGVVAVDLAGDEANFPVEDHAEVFERAKASGLHITIHAGEAAGAQSVAKAIELGAERIGHGVRSFEDPEVLAKLKEKKILLEVCPKSNRHTKAVRNISEHPVKEYFDKGIRVSINTDNRTVSNTSLTDEYQLVMEELGFTVDEIKKMILYAAETVFLPESERDQLVQEIKAELDL
ncbi:adenosine deaminase [Anoxybacter fermentans]|uniref:adenosine deaminase n=1 Tax=Anoxybacter fermentans TaxID=1323375 RepID=UPI00196B1451|nr:adenosine deaminase [Anoxybacter fermentans]